MNLSVFTIGHSTHSAEKFRDLLLEHKVTAIADVRSSPYSRFNAHFNREQLRSDLRASRVAYVFLGEELGARSEDRSCYVDNKVQYDRLAQTALFQHGLDRVLRGAHKHRIALMCAEKDPLTCHRCILVSRYLAARDVDIQHILADGRIESHTEALARLLRELQLPELFQPREALVDEAYRVRGDEIAYVEKGVANSERPGGFAR